MVSYTRDLNSYSERAEATQPACRGWLLLLLFAVPLLARLYLLYIPAPLNIDEAQWTVSARSVLTDPIVWRSTDMQTSGPLNALAISWPVLFGLTPSILTSRLTGLVLQSLTILGMASLIRRGEALSPGTAAVLTTAVALTLAVNPDFLHYSSELVSAGPDRSLLRRLRPAAGRGAGRPVARALRPDRHLPALREIAVRAVFPALSRPVPRAARHGHQGRGGRSRAELLLYLFASSLPVLLLVAPLFVVGEQDAFLTGYLGLGAGYAAVRTLRIFPDLLRLVILMGGLTAVLLARTFDPAQRRRCRADLLLLGLALWPTTLLTMWLPGRYFSHYELFGLVCLPLAVIVLQDGLPPRHYRWPSAAAQTVALFAVALAAAVPIHHNLAANFAQARMDAAFAPKGADFTAALRLDRRVRRRHPPYVGVGAGTDGLRGAAIGGPRVHRRISDPPE